MQKFALPLLLAGTAIAATPAIAQDAPADVNPVFTGPRVEALVGYDINSLGSSIDNENGSGDNNFEGALYGVGAGFDFAFGGALVGVEGEYAGSTADSSEDAGDQATFGNIKAGRDLYIGARAGFLATPETLVYVKGGYTNAQYKLDGTTFDTGGIGTTGRLRAELDGYRLGAGVERAVSLGFGSGAYAKLEYRYSNYGDGQLVESGGGDVFGDDELAQLNDLDFDRHQIVFGLGVRF